MSKNKRVLTYTVHIHARMHTDTPSAARNIAESSKPSRHAHTNKETARNAHRQTRTEKKNNAGKGSRQKRTLIELRSLLAKEDLGRSAVISPFAPRAAPMRWRR